MKLYLEKFISATHNVMQGPDSAIQTSRFALMLMFVGTLIIPLIIIGTSGSVVVGAAFLFTIAIVILTFYRLDWGFILWLGLVLVSDNYEIPGFHPITYSTNYLMTLNVTFPGLGFGVLAPVELHFLLFLFIFIIVGMLKKNIKKRENPILVPAVLFFGWIIVSLLYGKSRGGDIQMGGWEIRALIFFALTFFVARYIITTKEQIKNL